MDVSQNKHLSFINSIQHMLLIKKKAPPLFLSLFS